MKTLNNDKELSKKIDPAEGVNLARRKTNDKETFENENNAREALKNDAKNQKKMRKKSIQKLYVKYKEKYGEYLINIKKLIFNLI